MGKFSVEDKLRIQTLREQRMGAKAIKSAYPDKNWSLSTLKAMCRGIDATKFAQQQLYLPARRNSGSHSSDDAGMDRPTLPGHD